MSLLSFSLVPRDLRSWRWCRCFWGLCQRYWRSCPWFRRRLWTLLRCSEVNIFICHFGSLFVCLLFVYHIYILFRPHMKGWAKVLIGKVGAFLSEESFRNSSVLISLISDPPPKYLFTTAFLWNFNIEIYLKNICVCYIAFFVVYKPKYYHLVTNSLTH